MANMIKSFIYLLKDWGKILFTFIVMYFISFTNKNIEVVALRSQLALYKEKELNHKIKKPLVSTAFRQFWVILSKFFLNWKDALVVVKPETVIRWHKTAFKIY
jgi:hypothetical protein